MRRPWTAALAMLALAAGAAASASPPQPQGEPRPGPALRDEEFGVARRGFGLERRVEMYQWSAGDSGFRRVWNAAPIDSAGFPENRQNPPGLPLESRRWWSSEATLDGHPVDVGVLKALGEWRQFRPSFSRLPGNLAATFQPDGDGLSSSANPLDPQIGDLRVTWHERELPPLAGQVELRDGRWQLAPPGGDAPEPLLQGDAAAEAHGLGDDGAGNHSPLWPWWLALVALVLVALVLWRLRRR